MCFKKRFFLLTKMFLLWGFYIHCVVAPRGFYKEGGGQTDQVAVGSKNGRMVAFQLIGGKPYLFNIDTMADDPWILQRPLDINGHMMPIFRCVAAASDGSVYVVGDDGHIYRYYWRRAEMPITGVSERVQIPLSYFGRWVAVGVNKKGRKIIFDQVAVGHEKEVWALDKQGVFYRLENGGWVAKSSSEIGQWIAVGLDGTVIGILSTAGVCQWNGEQFQPLPHAPQLKSVAVVSQNELWGIGCDDADGVSLLWKYELGSWIHPKSKKGCDAQGFVAVAANAAGAVFLIDDDGYIYANGDEGVALPVILSHPEQVESMDKKKKCMRSKKKRRLV